MRAALISTLSIFVGLAAAQPGVAQERASMASPAMRVNSVGIATSPQPMGSAVLGFVASTATGGLSRRASGPPGYSSSSVLVRAILGVPGAATLSGPLALPRGIQSVYFAPGENFALVEELAGTLALIQFSGIQAGAPLTMPGTISRPDMVGFSPNAGAAAVFSAAQGHLLIITGLPGAPQLSRDLSGGDIPAGIQALALADDGVTLLAATSDGRVLVLRSGSAPAPVYSGGQVGGIAFAPASTDAVLFDGAGAKVMMLQNIASAPSTRLLAEGLPGISGAALLQIDGGAAFVGAVNAKQVERIDLQTLRVDNLTLPAGLTMLQPLRAAHRFLTSAQAGQPGWILDASTEPGAVYFVPRQSLAFNAR
jgi:hypothetical protein